jgi:exonuclease SbcC
MLPIRLELKNFLAYRAPEPLNFRGIDIACLSGPNGAGKSSLLDAITWALWGEARTHSDDELIHMGQDDMHVIFDFQQDQSEYRVIRKRSKRGRGQSSLTVLKRVDDEGGLQFESLTTDRSVRETQQYIDQLLRLDYETFVHSAFLQQGKADAFTVKSAGERKKILADILGLERWEKYEKQVKEQLQSIDSDLTVIDGWIAQYEQEEIQEPALRRELEHATQQVAEAQQTREAAENRLAEVAGAPTAMQSAQAQEVSARRREQQYRQDLATISAEYEQQQKRLAAYQEIVAAREDIEDGYSRLETARQTDYELVARLSQQADVERHLHELERQLDAERADLEAQLQLSLGRIQEAEQTVADSDQVEAEVAEVDAELDRLERRIAERDTLQTERQTLSEELVAIQTRNEALRIEMDDIKKRLTMLDSVDEAICPICRQPLDEPHRAELSEQYKVEGKQRGDTFRANRARVETINGLIAEHNAAIIAADTEVESYDEQKGQQGALRERLSVVQEAEQRIEIERVTLNEIQAMLDNENYSLELRAQISDLRAEIERLGYDKYAHSEAREALQTLRSFEAQKRELDTAIQSLPDVERTVQNLQERHERCEAQLAEASEEVAALQQQVISLGALVQEHKERQAEVNRLRTIERGATEKLIGIQQQLNAIDVARRRKAEKQAQRAALCDDRTIYEQLRDAFGKNGVPAMVIEAAIPELEDATNKLLVNMTDGRMHVRFDTQREKKAGEGVIETLDILVSDELGTRKYDTFSGGERFRVNFALRIALSQFLARRAGARLQTLVIDEGFGSQDEIGRERLVDAINAIRPDFSLIIIVTHIDELRDQFPIHIEIRKQTNGSTISVH